MKISQKVVKNKPYYYALDSIYINRGKTIQKSRSLGAKATATNLGMKKQEFLKDLIKEEVKLRIDYWESRASKDFLAYLEINKAEQLRSELFRKKKNIGDLGSAAMETAFLVDFIYNSNKLEGSRVPRASVEKIVREASGEKNSEVRNTMAAINFIKQGKFNFTIPNIEKLHDTLLAHEPVNLRYRKDNDIIVGNSKVSDYKNIKKELVSLIGWLKENNYELYPLELAFTFYYRFERIHPFKDGNGRVGRLLMNEILKVHKYHPMIIWNKNREAHMNVFTKAIEDGSKSSFFRFMLDQFNKTHESYLTRIEKAYNLERMLDTFLEPTEQDD